MFFDTCEDQVEFVAKAINIVNLQNADRASRGSAPFTGRIRLIGGEQYFDPTVKYALEVKLADVVTRKYDIHGMGRGVVLEIHGAGGFVVPAAYFSMTNEEIMAAVPLSDMTVFEYAKYKGIPVYEAAEIVDAAREKIISASYPEDFIHPEEDEDDEEDDDEEEEV